MTCSSNWLGRPLRTVTSSPRPSRNSSTTRVLPIPGSPSSVTRCARRRSCTRSNVSVSSASSRRRSTNGIVDRVERGASRITGHAAISRSNSFGRIMRISPNSTASFTSSRVVEPTRTSRGSAACCSRAPMFTSPPITMPRSAAVPTATRPVLIPTCTSMGNGSPSSRPSSRRPVHHGERGADRAHGVVVVGRRHAEHRQDRVADERLGAAAQPLDLLGHHPVERREHLAEAFGVQVRRQLRRAHQIDEDHGDQPPLRGRLDRDRGAAVADRTWRPRGSGSSHRAHVASLTPQGYGGSGAGTPSRPTPGPGSWPSAPGTRPPSARLWRGGPPGARAR